MNLRGQLQRITEIDKLIREKETGTPSMLAKKLNISESELYYILKTMKEIGGQIKYSYEEKSYYYTTPLKFTWGYVPE